jgi:hypothetical protein
MPLLSEAEFLATFNAPMRQAGPDDEPPFDFWEYVEAIPARDFEGRDCSEGSVRTVYRDASGRYEHVLIDSDDREVFMVVVLDRESKTVLGHRLLDLPRLYGLRDDNQQA